jgi:hypothetical protein
LFEAIGITVGLRGSTRFNHKHTAFWARRRDHIDIQFRFAAPLKLRTIRRMVGLLALFVVAFENTGQIRSFGPGEFVNRYRIRIDPEKSKDTDAVIRFEFTDASNKAVALHVRRGVVDYVESPDHYYRKADFILSQTRDVWGEALSQSGDRRKTC